jgi:hypothetical protein
MIPLSDPTRSRLNVLFKSSDLAEAERALTHECAENVVLHPSQLNPEGLERIRFAALRVSHGNLHSLLDASRSPKLIGVTS